ncbi:MAG: S49 family peptidase, partial [Pseudomonadota bacterium]
MNVIRRVFELLWRGLDGLRKVLHLIVLLFLFALVLAAFRERVPIVPEQAALVIAPQGALVEELSGDAFDRAVGEITGDREPEALVPDIVEAIRAAAKDDRIDALVLETEDLTGGGLAKLRAIARAIEEFRAAGKKVYAHGEYVTQTQYYLMAQADEAYLEPQGAVGVDGFSVYSPFLKGGLDKLGVSVSVFRSGAYKSLGEPFTRTDMSPEVKAETQEWLGALWLAYAEGVAQPRGLEPARLRDAFRIGEPQRAEPLLRLGLYLRRHVGAGERLAERLVRARA